MRQRGQTTTRVIERVGDEPRRRKDGPDGHLLPALGARRGLLQPAREADAAEHLAAARFHDRVEQGLMADAAHELVVYGLGFHIAIAKRHKRDQLLVHDNVEGRERKSE
jgi:hypothetical protein